MKWIAVATLALSVIVPAADVYAQTRANIPGNEKDIFLALRDAARKDDAVRAWELADRLIDHPIPSYVEYYRLKPRIKIAPQNEILSYLQRYQGSAIADRLRNDWLLELGKQRDWATFDSQYPQFVLDDDVQVKCYALQSALAKGQQVAGQARELLTAPRRYGAACPLLVEDLLRAGQFSADDVWQQVRLAAEHNMAGVARDLALLVGAPESVIKLALESPVRVIATGPGAGRAHREAFLIALGRAARSNTEQAANALRSAGSSLSKAQTALGWAQIALQSSLKVEPQAAEYWRLSRGAALSQEGYQWQARAALRSGDWKFVDSAIQAMPARLQEEDAWVYWLGRAERELGRHEHALGRFESILTRRGFYGQLALEELGHRITIPERARQPSADEVARMAANPGLRNAFYFYAINLRFEGNREWNWQLRGMNERELLAAAEFARQNDVLDRMVNTSDRTRNEYDFEQRFPAPHADVMRPASAALRLDMAWVYGLIRQESRFIMSARSSAGASGLMQLMPGTAREVARKIGMTDYHQSKVNELQTNILLGTNYLNMVLERLDGSQVLATAAYNAGPRRPLAWRATLARPVEGAIFAETIPFTETRDYVKNVLSNATYYAAMFENKSQSLKERLGSVAAQGYDGQPTSEPF